VSPLSNSAVAADAIEDAEVIVGGTRRARWALSPGSRSLPKGKKGASDGFHTQARRYSLATRRGLLDVRPVRFGCLPLGRQ
jgi:hypothetical protein